MSCMHVLWTLYWPGPNGITQTALRHPVITLNTLLSTGFMSLLVRGHWTSSVVIWWFILTRCRSSLLMRSLGQSSRSQEENVFWLKLKVKLGKLVPALWKKIRIGNYTVGHKKWNTLIFVCNFEKNQRILVQFSLLDLKMNGTCDI